MTLIEHLKQLPDFRKARGQRHSQWLLLLLLLLGAMSGYWGYRPLAEFTQRYGSAIYAELNLPPQTRLPSYSTFRRLMQGLDYTVLATMFTDWASTEPTLCQEDWLAGDGKALGATLTHHKGTEQNFVSLVSVGGASDYCWEDSEVMPTPRMVTQPCSLRCCCPQSAVLPDPIEIAHY